MRVLIVIGAMALTGILLYLIGSLTTLNWSIYSWDSFPRGFVGLLVVAAGISAYAGTYEENKTTSRTISNQNNACELNDDPGGEDQGTGYSQGLPVSS